jgi:hypothetical protein
MGQNSSITRLFHQIGDSIRGARYSRTDYNDEKRIITINSGPQPAKFISNRISTSKYSLLTFIPKFLFEQFRKYSNIFFLCIVIFQVNRKTKENISLTKKRISFSKFPVYHQLEDIQQLFH